MAKTKLRELIKTVDGVILNCGTRLPSGYIYLYSDGKLDCKAIHVRFIKSFCGEQLTEEESFKLFVTDLNHEFLHWIIDCIAGGDTTTLFDKIVHRDWLNETWSLDIKPPQKVISIHKKVWGELERSKSKE